MSNDKSKKDPVKPILLIEKGQPIFAGGEVPPTPPSPPRSQLRTRDKQEKKESKKKEK